MMPTDDDQVYLDDDGQPFDPEQADRDIREFIEKTDQRWSPPTSELTQQAIAIVRGAWEEIAAITSGQPNDKVLAMMLHASRTAREIDPREREYWITSAASTILSSQIPNAQPPAEESD